MTRSTLGPSRQGSPGPISGDLFSLTQGVSQMPQHMRPPGVADEQINAWSSTVEGLRKRQPSELLKTLSPVRAPALFAARFVVSEHERYALMILQDVTVPEKKFLGIFDMETWARAELTVRGAGLTLENGPGGTPDGGGRWMSGGVGSYLESEELIRGFVLLNNATLGLLLNREKVTKMLPDLSPAPPNQSMLFIQGVAYDITYTVRIDGVVVGTYTTPKASDNDNQLSQTKVASEMATALDAIAGIKAVSKDYIVHVTKDDGSPVKLGMDDGRGNTLGRAINDDVVSTAELPTLAPAGFVVRSSNEPGTKIDDRWFKFVPFVEGATGIVEGSWQETVKPGIPFKIDRETMPLVIHRARRGHFFIGPADGSKVTDLGDTYEFPEWGNRTAGDEESVKDPAFIGKPIRDHVLFRGRYMTCSGSRIMFSEIDDIFNFFLDSTVQVQDSDPIDLLANAALSTELQWLVVVDEMVLVFSPEVQFNVRSSGDSDVLSPRSAMILPISQITMNTDVRPTMTGASILFATNEFGFVNVREMQAFDSQQRRLGLNLGAGLNLSRTVPKYVRGQATHWGLGENQDYAAIMTDDDPRTLYIYKYLWSISGNTVSKVQTAWSKWTFAVDIEFLMFDQNYLYIFTGRDVPPGRQRDMSYPAADGTQVLRLATEELQLEANPNILLDRRVQYPEFLLQATYDPITQVTTFQLPYTAASRAHAISVMDLQDPTANEQGLLLGSAEPGATQIECTEILGDHRWKRVVLGEEYEMKFVFSKAFVQTQDRDRQTRPGDTEGRLQVLTWETVHRDTGFYQVRVQRPQRPDSVSTFRSRVLAVSGNRLTTETDVVSDGKMRVPVYGKNTDVTISVESSNWLPVVITSARWEGVQSIRSKSR
jgi:hypothetical protein